MSTEYKISNLVDNQFPEYIRENGPNLVAFIRAYYEWMEEEGKATDVSKNLLNNQDIDTAQDQYLDYLLRELMPTIPKEILSDERLAAKHIKELYRSRGSEQSYRMLFRILFGEEIEFYYPNQDILKASDGIWVQETSVRVGDPSFGSIDELNGEFITGEISGAIGRVEKIIGTFEGGTNVSELYLSNIEGTFQDGEAVTNETGTVSGTIVSTVGPMQRINVIKGGAFHRSDDSVVMFSTSGSGANGIVTSTSDTSAVEWQINDGGSGYTTGAQIAISGGSGFDANFTVTGISNTELIAINDDTIGPMRNVVLNTQPNFVAAGANTSSVSASLAAANVNSTLSTALAFSNLTIGTISSITTTDFGYGYLSVPSSVVTEPSVSNLNIPDESGGFKGRNADVVAVNVPGAIEEVRVLNFGTGYNKYDPVTISNISRSGTQAAIGNPEISGIITYPGKYIDTRGWLSWNNKLQDNFYYQQFSYEIKSNQFVNTYRKLVNTIVHPAGYKMFGRYRIQSDVELPLTAITTADIHLDVSASSTANISIPTIATSTEIRDANTRIKIVAYEEVTSPTLEASTVTNVLKLGTGTLNVTSNNLILYYASNTVNEYQTVPIYAIGTPKLVNGNNTIFTSEVANGTTIMVVGTPNTAYTTNVVYSDTKLTVTNPISGGYLNDATFYYIANTS